jgi:hypothetical protein
MGLFIASMHLHLSGRLEQTHTHTQTRRHKLCRLHVNPTIASAMHIRVPTEKQEAHEGPRRI